MAEQFSDKTLSQTTTSVPNNCNKTQCTALREGDGRKDRRGLMEGQNKKNELIVFRYPSVKLLHVYHSFLSLILLKQTSQGQTQRILLTDPSKT